MTAYADDSPPTVYVVDDDESVRESLNSLLRSAGLSVEAFDSPTKFLEQGLYKPLSCLVLDVRMPEMNGLELQNKLLAKGIEIPIIFITGHGDVPLVVRAMRAGAVDFLNKPFNDTDLLGAIEFALSKLEKLRNENIELDIFRHRYETLTPREKEVLLAVSLGKANKLIAFELNVSESTIKVHRHNAMIKMNVRSVAALTRVMERMRK